MGITVDGEPIRLTGLLGDRANLSGIARHADALLVGSDEGRCIQRLVLDREGGYRAAAGPIRLSAKKGELDIEALSCDGSLVYVLCSHARVRKPIKPGLSQAANHQRFLNIRRDRSRDRLLRMRIQDDGRVERKIDQINLRSLLNKDPLLAPFARIPSKENGVDLEGIAEHQRRLWIGCRGPVLRYNLVPVLVLDFDRPRRYQRRLVQLGGQGIRDLATVEGGLLVLAGPVGDTDGPFSLWFWDGEDQMPGAGRPLRVAEKLGDLDTPTGGKAEGLEILEQGPDGWRVLVLFDGITDGAPRHYRVDRP
jgi:hypothetical protein